MYRQNKLPSLHVSPSQSTRLSVPLETETQLLLLHRPVHVSIPPPVAPVLHWSCSSEAVRITLVKRNTESSILFVESEGLSHCTHTLKLLFSPSQFAAWKSLQ